MFLHFPLQDMQTKIILSISAIFTKIQNLTYIGPERKHQQVCPTFLSMPQFELVLFLSGWRHLKNPLPPFEKKESLNQFISVYLTPISYKEIINFKCMVITVDFVFSGQIVWSRQDVPLF